MELLRLCWLLWARLRIRASTAMGGSMRLNGSEESAQSQRMAYLIRLVVLLHRPYECVLIRSGIQHDTFFVKSLITPLDAPLTADTYTTWGQYILDTQHLAAPLSWFLQIELYGGANSQINVPASNDTAFPFRDCLFTIQLYASAANFEPPYPFANGYNFLGGIVNLIEKSEPHADFGAYANYIDPTLQNWQDKYYKGNYPRLLALQKVRRSALLI
jgi:hypothetical protein